MVNTKKIVTSKDYSCFLIALLSNPNIHPLIDEEYNKNWMKYDGLMFKDEFSQKDYCKGIPEDIIDWGLKLTGIFLSSRGNKFLIKVLKLGWPNLYNYIKSSGEVVYEEIKEIENYGLDNLDDGYTIIIIKLISDIFNKKVIYINDKSKDEIDSYNKRLGFTVGTINKKQVCKELEEDFQSILQNIKYENILRPQVNSVRNNYILNGILHLFSFYSIDILGITILLKVIKNLSPLTY